MAAPEGNNYWERRSTHGRDKIFSSEEMLWDAAVEYFKWVQANPLKEAKLFKIKNDKGNDEIVSETVNKMRATTIEGLCLFMGIGVSTWYDYADDKDFSDIIGRINNSIRTQKFEGAAADLLNANIIARDLGLKESTSNEHSGPNGSPLEILIKEISGSTLDPND